MRYRDRHNVMLGPNKRPFSQLTKLIHKVTTFASILNFNFFFITNIDKPTQASLILQLLILDPDNHLVFEFVRE